MFTWQQQDTQAQPKNDASGQRIKPVRRALTQRQ